MSAAFENIKKHAAEIIKWPVADEAGNSLQYFLGKEHADKGVKVISLAILSEREACISIAQSIEPHNEAEAHLIETIVRKMRGDE